ncbi:MAG: DUF4397 domain-containing protein [Ignavibacteria bacterium]|nr:DUF4397 domain-containing protein [Ignavibacteria bacterium]MBT8381072.1 DUF4397 domain-containing protein [Ignavibacteria bacterium]MBT8392334.1 DUF4397 domain-containing protein [Ignavibacteria bacterium]NNJ53248.1 DUF4397 domain-containing protein [Ignavibacteriaceae bacterium]NNL19970.1 DUF4397 domain-containing protein [Ignavibacteriaceae bacterium]
MKQLFSLFILAIFISGLALAQSGDSEETLIEQEKALNEELSPSINNIFPVTNLKLQVDNPLFVGVDDATLPTAAFVGNPDSATWVAAFGGAEVWGSAYDPVNDKVYFNSGSTLLEWPVGGAINTLGTITDSVGATLSFVGLAFYNETLYGTRNVANEAIYIINPTTLVASVHIDYEDADYDFGGFSVDPNTGDFYGTSDDATPGRGLYRINPNGTATLIADYPSGETDIDGLAVSDDGFAYLVIDQPGDIFVWDFVGGVYATPFANPWTTSEIFSGGAWIYEAGGGTARVQVIHNSADLLANEVDVYIDGALALDNFAFRTATPYIDLPAGVVVNIGVAPGNSGSVNDTLKNFPVTLTANETYVVFANGVLDTSLYAANPDGRNTSFTLFVKDMARETGLGSDVDFFVLHGSTDAPTVDVKAREAGNVTLVDDAAYSDITPYIQVPPADYTLDLYLSDGVTLVESFIAPLSGLGGGAAAVFASGFLDPSGNQNGAAFGIFAALPDGSVVEFVPGVVPVELSSFVASVNGNDVELRWETATELNNRGFSVERKTTSSEYTEVGFVPGFGTTTDPKSYSFSDQGLQSGTYIYRLKQVDFDGAYQYSNEVEVEIGIPGEFNLNQNYPNPFNPSTKITFSLAADSKVSLKVFNVLGQEVTTLVNQDLTAGVHNYDFDAANINSGVYFYKIEATGVNGIEFTEVKKMILAK